MGKSNRDNKRVRIAGFIVATTALCMVMVFGCAPKSPSTVANETKEEPISIEFTWAEDADCALCHSSEVASMTDASCQAAPHAQEGETCVSCHTDQAALVSVHEGALPSSTMPQRLEKTTIAEDICISCHGSLDELATKTKGSTALVDSEGTVVNPHELPVSEDHSALSCTDCHRMHQSGTLGDIAKQACITCHHADVFECGTCHEEQ